MQSAVYLTVCIWQKRPDDFISFDSKKGMALADDHNEPVKLRDKAYQSFTQHLLARDFHPGQFVSQRQLVTMTGLPLGRSAN